MSVVTFTTDFGTVDGYAGAMKGVVLALAPDAVLVDITHDVPRHDVAAGAFALAQAAPLFPLGSVHVAVVDPGVGGPRADIVVEAGGCFFLGPDNGLVSLAARGPRLARRISRSELLRTPTSPTFHGRDVLACAAGRLASGAQARELGPLVEAIEDLAIRGGTAADAAVIVHVDAFGNLITSLQSDSIPQDLLMPGTRLICSPEGRDAFAVRAGRTYSDVARGELVLYVGSAGYLEIAVREGSAAEHTGLGRGQALRLAGAP